MRLVEGDKIKNFVYHIWIELKNRPDNVYHFSTDDIMDIPTARSNAYDTAKCHATVSTVKVKLKNTDKVEGKYQLSKFIYDAINSENTSIFKAKARIFEEKGTSKKQVYGGIIRSISLDEYETYYELEIADIQEELKTTLFVEFFSVIAAEQPVLPVGFSQVDIKDEEGKIIAIKIVFEGNPFTMLKGMLGMLIGEYADWYVAEDFAEAKYAGPSFYYEFTEKLESPMEWIETNILKPLNYFPFIDNEGKFRIKKQQQPTVDTGIILGKSSLMEVPKKKIDFSKIINNIYVNNEYDWETNEYMRKDLFVDEVSIMKHGKIPKDPATIEIQGIQKFIEIDRRKFVENCAKTVFERFAGHSIAFTAKVLMSKGAALNVGDFVMLEHDKVMEWEGTGAGTRGIGAAGGARYAVIGTDTWADYSGTEDNDELGYLTVNYNEKKVFSGQVIRVSRVIREELFTTMKDSNDKVMAFLTAHGR